MYDWILFCKLHAYGIGEFTDFVVSAQLTVAVALKSGLDVIFNGSPFGKLIGVDIGRIPEKLDLYKWDLRRPRDRPWVDCMVAVICQQVDYIYLGAPYILN